MPNITRKIDHGSDKARQILNEVRARIRMSQTRLGGKHDKWRQAEETTLAYMPEREVDRLRRNDRENGLPQYTTIQLPYTSAVLLSAHTYLTSVFFGRDPVFQYTGRHGEGQQKVMAMEALIEHQRLMAGWLPPLYTWLYDAGKYGVGVLGTYWEERIEAVTTITETEELDILNRPTGKKTKTQETKPITTYTGNKVYNIQPWDFLFDVRVTLRDFQKGEYCAVPFALSWNECKRKEFQGYFINLDKVQSSKSGENYGDNQLSTELDRPEATGGSDTAGTATGYYTSGKPRMVKGYECHIEIIPEEWGLGSSPYPEKWVFSCTQDFSVLLGAAPLGALHCSFPFSVLPLEMEGYGLVTRGMPEQLEPIQNTLDWLINSHFYNVRATLNNNFVVDPSRVVMKDVLNPAPGRIMRLKPSAYGTDPRMAVHQLVTQDVTQNNLRDLQIMQGFGEKALGVNDQLMGAMNTGGRKTATEIRTSTSFGVNRMKTIAEWFSAVGFDSLSMMTVKNSQQYYSGEMKMKIAGSMVQQAGVDFVNVTPDEIAGNFMYVPVDGTLPVDRYAQANLWRELMAQMRNFPQIMMQYDVAKIFDWVAQISGLKNIGQFRVQLGSPEALQQQAMMGNVVPMGGPGAKPAGPGGPAPRQTSGMGPSG
jgi:hypothetical protein